MAFLVEINGFGKWLRAKREAKGLTMRALAEKADNVCSPSYIAQIETNYYIGRKGAPMQPSEEIVEKLAIALGEPISEARRAANYSYIDEEAEKIAKSDLSDILQRYDRLSVKSRQLANRQFNNLIDFLLEFEGIKIEDDSEDETENAESSSESSNKPEILSDLEISRLGIKPIKVEKIKKRRA